MPMQYPLLQPQQAAQLVAQAGFQVEAQAAPAEQPAATPEAYHLQCALLPVQAVQQVYPSPPESLPLVSPP